MTKTSHSTRPAGVALAAALALASTPALAQFAPDPLGAPAAPAPEPVIVVPDIPPPVASPAPTVSVPVIVPEAVPAAAPQPRTTAAAPTRRAPAASAAPAPAAPVAAPRAVEPAPIEDAAPIAPAVDVAPVVAETTAPAARPANDNTGLIAFIAGALIVIGLAIWGFVALGRRKLPAQRVATPVAARPLAERPRPQPVPAARPEAPVVATPAAPEPIVPPQPAIARQPVVVAGSAGGLAHAGASVALPRKAPESYAEREALLKRMIEAKPDRANPFKDRGARAKRARLILASLGQDFSDREPWIDLSQYPNNWPELARRQQAA